MDHNEKDTSLRLHFFERLQQLERDSSLDEAVEITLTKAEAGALLQDARPDQVRPQYPAAIAPGPAQFVAEVLAHLTRVLDGGQQPPSHVPLTTNPTGAITPQQSEALIGALATTLAPPQAAHPTHQPAQKKRRTAQRDARSNRGLSRVGTGDPWRAGRRLPSQAGPRPTRPRRQRRP